MLSRGYASTSAVKVVRSLRAERPPAEAVMRWARGLFFCGDAASEARLAAGLPG